MLQAVHFPVGLHLPAKTEAGIRVNTAKAAEGGRDLIERNVLRLYACMATSK